MNRTASPPSAEAGLMRSDGPALACQVSIGVLMPNLA
jgi:hypothetical protein